MALPSIAPYPMPTDGDLPASVPAWKPRADRAALLIHDMQRYFVGAFPPGDSPAVALTANIARLRAAATIRGMPVLYTAQPGRMTRADRGLLHDVWGEGMSGTPQERAIVAELAPADPTTVITKWRYSAFVRTDLADRLSRAGRDQLIVCGVYAHVGVLMTVCDAFSRDIEVFVPGDAVADFTPAYHQSALTYVAERCGVVTSTSRLIEEL